jgi:gas vesicle protein
MSDTGSEIGAFMAGFVIGGLVGAATALILAPQSGAETRAQIATKSHEIRDAGVHQYEVARVHVHDTATQAQEQARIVLDEGKSRVSSARSGDAEVATEAQDDVAAEEPEAGEEAAA